MTHRTRADAPPGSAALLVARDLAFQADEERRTNGRTAKWKKFNARLDQALKDIKSPLSPEQTAQMQMEAAYSTPPEVPTRNHILS